MLQAFVYEDGIADNRMRAVARRHMSRAFGRLSQLQVTYHAGLINEEDSIKLTLVTTVRVLVGYAKRAMEMLQTEPPLPEDRTQISSIYILGSPQ